MITLAAFLSSSMAEHSAVNRRVVSSSLTWGAKQRSHPSGWLFCFSCMRTYSPRLTAAAVIRRGAERPRCGMQRGGSAGETGRKAHSARFSTMFHHGMGCKFESYLGSHVAANVESFAATFLFLEEMSPLTLSVAAPFRKRSRSDFLLTCKRVRDENLSLPTFCGQVRYQHSYHQRNLFCLPGQKRFLCCFMRMNIV